MCLFRLKKPIPKVKYAYKVFEKYKNYNTDKYELQGLYFSISTPITENKWIKNFSIKNIVTPLGETYTSGFHCFTNKREAIKFIKRFTYNENFVLYKIEINDITGYGYQRYKFKKKYKESLNVIVCNNIKLIKLIYEIKEK